MSNSNKIRIPESLRRTKNLIGIFSAKGGVGKSFVASNIALYLSQQGYKVGLVDGDIYGPSLPKILNTSGEELKVSNQEIMEPLNTNGIKFMSMGLINSEKTPVIWRGPMVSGAMMQLLSQTNWGALDFLIIDTPPGTGDVQLTLLQKIPLTAALIVTTPHEVAITDCKKGIEMVNKLKVPILGLVENMSWFQPESKKKYYIFGKNGSKELIDNYGIKLLGQIPLVEAASSNELIDGQFFNDIFQDIVGKVLIEVERLKKDNNSVIPYINQ
tara:strand:- start:4391 stop:5203 length:813 start_codon:yes stop_codon:yes gene_type:complete